VRAIYAGKESGGEVAGYTLAQMTSYYLLVTIVDCASTAVNEDDWQIAPTFKDGNISQFLLNPSIIWPTGSFVRHRPADLHRHRGRAGSAVHSAPAGNFCPAAGLGHVRLVLVSTVMTALLQFFMSTRWRCWRSGCRSFDVHILLFAFEYIAATFVSVNILPLTLAQALNYTPFPYQMFFPVSIYLGQTSGPALWEVWHSGVLGHGYLRPGALFLEPRHSKILSRGRMNMPADIPPSAARALHWLRRYLDHLPGALENSIVREMVSKRTSPLDRRRNALVRAATLLHVS